MTNKSLRVLQISDTHLHADREATMRSLNTYESFKAVVEHVQNSGHHPDIILATGDLVQDETRHGYDLFCQLVKGFDAPVHCIPGNHDSPGIMAEMLGTTPFHYCGSAQYANWHIVMLDSTVRWNDGGLLNAMQLEALDKTLDDQAQSHVLIGLHHHPLPTGSRWLDGLNLRNCEEFLAVVDRHQNVRAIVWGHVHQNSERLRNGVTMLSTPSTGAQFRPQSDVFMMDDRPPGYRWLQLFPDGRVETEVVWIS